MLRHRIRSLILLLAIASSLGADAPAEPPRILFIHLRIKDGQFSVVSTTNAPGVLKARRAPAASRDYQLVLEDGGGREQWRHNLADPRIRRFEYEDPDPPGALKVKEVRVTETECVVRVPDVPGPRRLAIYRVQTLPRLKADDPPKRELIVRLELPERKD